MLQYCVLYAKIQKLNMSNIMNKTNSDNEVYEESDLLTRPGAEVQGVRMPVPHTDVPFWSGLLQIT